MARSGLGWQVNAHGLPSIRGSASDPRRMGIRSTQGSDCARSGQESSRFPTSRSPLSSLGSAWARGGAGIGESERASWAHNASEQSGGQPRSARHPAPPPLPSIHHRRIASARGGRSPEWIRWGMSSECWRAGGLAKSWDLVVAWSLCSVCIAQACSGLLRRAKSDARGAHRLNSKQPLGCRACRGRAVT